MKSSFVFIVLNLFFLSFSIAQTTTSELRQLVQTYQLDESQQQEVAKLLDTKAQNLTALAAIQTEQPEMYEVKRLHVEINTQMGLKSLLTEAQLSIFETEAKKKAATLDAKLNALLEAGVSKTAIQQLRRQVNQ